MAMLIAALCADGITEIGNIRQIDRGYERIDERLRELGRASRATGRRARLRRVSAGLADPAEDVRVSSGGSMIDRIPSGTRDVLPDEMRELRAMTDRIRGVFDARRLRRGLHAGARIRADAPRGPTSAATRPAYRMFDEHGQRARTALGHDGADRPAGRDPLRRTSEPPLRFCYVAHAYRGVRPQRGQTRELLQAGVELIGAPGAGGTAEALTRAVRTRWTPPGLKSYRVGLGDAALYPALLERLRRATPTCASGSCTELAAGDFVGVEREVARARPRGRGVGPAAAPCPQLRGGPEVLADSTGPLHDAIERHARASTRCWGRAWPSA